MKKLLKFLAILLLLVGSNWFTYHISYFTGSMNCDQETMFGE